MQSSRSALVCPCHDVTAADIDSVIEAGHTSPETIKRATAVYMGSCQGKYCAPLVQALLIERGIESEGRTRRPAARAPIVSLPLGAFVESPDSTKAAESSQHGTTGDNAPGRSATGDGGGLVHDRTPASREDR